jgi:iron complex transport system ATP-binding protein
MDHQLETMELVRGLAESEKLTVIVVSHDLNLVARYCDEFILMSAGRYWPLGR